jgi:hypothetical protein
MGKHAKGGNDVDHPVLDLIAFGEIPLREVSGLAVAPLREGDYLVAVGDHGPNVALAALLPDGGLGPWDVIDLSTLDAPPGAPKVEQAEAVATDGAHQAMVLIEDPALLLVLDTSARRLSRAYALDAGHHDGLDESWRNDASSRGEGMVLLADGHVLIVKEKRPAGLLEFGPEGDAPLGLSARTLHPAGEAWSPPATDRLVGLAWWPAPGDLDDLSDADVAPDGGLYLLSDQSSAIARLSLPLAVGGSARYESVWALPRDLEKAEGLAFLADGTALVAVDRHAVGRNLVTLPPVSDWPKR